MIGLFWRHYRNYNVVFQCIQTVFNAIGVDRQMIYEYNFIEMQGNFNINMPSIPTTKMLFKIQDVKAKGFNARESRFKDNKTYLTGRFISSFGNLFPPTPKKEIERNSEQSTNLSSFFRSDNDNFRMFVQQQKKNLLIKYQNEYKNYVPSIQVQSKFDKGYSFPRSGLHDTLDNELQKLARSNKVSGKVIDNYYFNTTEQSVDQEDDEDERIQLERRRAEKLAKRKIVHQSAAFKSEDRWQGLQRELKSKIKLGPGQYTAENQIKKGKRRMKTKQNKLSKELSIEKLKSIISETINPEEGHIQKQEQKGLPNLRRSSIFMEGNTDRFGKQIYPIGDKKGVPGPGAYDISDSLQDRANKTLILQEQRKLLKQWSSQT